MVFVMLLSFGSGAFAEVVNKSNGDSGLKIKLQDGRMLTEEEFIQYLYYNTDRIVKRNNTVSNLETKISKQDIGVSSYSDTIGAIPLWMIGEWFIPGIGWILVTASAIYMVGEIIKNGSWLWDKIMDFFSGGTGDPNRDLKDGYSLKKISNNKEANRIAQEHGYRNAELFKDDFVSNGARFNMHYCTRTFEIVLVSIMDSSVIVPTGLFM